jgi:hypothetical protein
VVCRLLVVDELVQVPEGAVTGWVKEVEIPEAFVSGDLHFRGGHKKKSE